jgi:hypothetical protein
MANRNWSSGGKIYSMHTMPILLDCNFVVDSTALTVMVWAFVALKVLQSNLHS